jgi:hypothetical protein
MVDVGVRLSAFDSWLAVHRVVIDRRFLKTVALKNRRRFRCNHREKRQKRECFIGFEACGRKLVNHKD